MSKVLSSETRSHLREGVEALQREDFETAERALLAILERDPDQSEAMHFLGLAYYQQDRHDASTSGPVALMERSLIARPDKADWWNNLGLARGALGRHVDAQSAFERSLSLRPDHPGTLSNLAVLLQAQGDRAGAESALRAALKRQPQNDQLRFNLAMLLANFGSLEESAELLGPIIDEFQDSPLRRTARAMRATLFLQLGRYTEGWSTFSARLAIQTDDRHSRIGGQPVWLPGTSGSIRVRPEQGLGEQILFSSVVPDLRSTSEPLLLECSARLGTIFHRSFGDRATVIPIRDRLKDPVAPADSQILIGDLCGHFRASAETFPKTPHLKADPKRTAKLRDAYRQKSLGRPVIGLSWYSRNKKIGNFKNVPVEALSTALAGLSAQFVSLQYGDTSQALAEFEASAGWGPYVDPTVDQSGDLDPFAAQVAAMDLVLTISNTTAHMAGALGVPAWIMAPPYARNIFWFGSSGERCDWYGSARIFRQSVPGKPAEMLMRLREELKTWIEAFR